MDDNKSSLYGSFHNVKILKLLPSNNIYIIPNALKLNRVIKNFNVQIVHAHLWKSVLIARLATPKNVRLLITLHSMLSIDAFQSRPRLILERLLYRSNQEVIAVTHAVMNDYSRLVNVTGQKHVIHNFVDNVFFNKTELKKQNHQIRLIAVGNLKSAKNYKFLFKALSLAKMVDFEMDVYGYGPQSDELQQIIKTYNIPVRLIGHKNNIETVLPHYDLFVMASVHEGYGIALAEAMASGVPVLISDIPSFKEVAGESAFYFSLNHYNDFIEQLTFLYKQHKNGKLYLWGEKCRNRAKQIASKELFFKKLEAIYNKN